MNLQNKTMLEIVTQVLFGSEPTEDESRVAEVIAWLWDTDPSQARKLEFSLKKVLSKNENC